MILFVLCGLPGSGKSTISKIIADKYNAKLFSLDDLRTGRGESRDRKDMYKEIFNSLLNDCNVVCDDLNIFIARRMNLLAAIEGIPCTKVLLVMTTTLDECIRRDAGRPKSLGEHIIKHLHGRYQPPSLDEGWDDILFI